MEILPATFLFFLLGTSVNEVGTLVPHDTGKHAYSGIRAALVEIMETSTDPRCNHLLFIDDGFSLTSTAVETLMAVNLPRGFGLFTAVKGQESNKTQQDWMSVVTVQARQMRMVSWCAMVILVTDNPIVLGTFAELSMKNQLLVSSTKLLAITQLPIRRLESIDYFHKVFSRMDAMILTFDDSSTVTSGLFIYLPNITPARGKIQLATLSSMGLTWVSDLPIFPDKYTKFLERPVMKIAREQIGEKQNEGCNQPLIAYMAEAMNFTCNMAYAAGNVYGTRNVDGTWSGMIGMLIREEADMSLAAFAHTPFRGQVVDYSIPLLVQYSTIVGKLGQPELDPWSFHLPLDAYVWLSILITLLLVPVVMVLLSWSSSSLSTRRRSSWRRDVFQLLRVLLQQDISTSHDSWRRRGVMATWLLVALVLVRSYASNLMSVMAVRYVQQPYQSLRNVLDDPSVTMIWQTNSSRVEYYRSARSGIFREVAEREKAGGIKLQLLHEFWRSMDTLLQRGDHVLVAVEIISRLLISHDFTKRGQCDFYTAKERILPVFLSVVGQKGSPIVPQLNRRIMAIQEAWLYDLWVENNINNSTACAQTPSRITNSSSLSLQHLWGMMAVLAGSHILGLLLLIWEMRSSPIKTS
ncbi:glutamate receptor ionotropic, delta-2-like [Scylla paramamosain]|uniref:glutamate receptor ionotropic, delta-2-like n=1 Tax=Scylla paramamosain TaxID=85552 RepID=UPI003082E87A